MGLFVFGKEVTMELINALDEGIKLLFGRQKC